MERMNELALGLIYGAAAGLMIPVGGYLASIERIQPLWLEQEFRHSMIAFGGGLLMSAVALVLVPEGLELVSVWVGLPAFVAGGVAFALLERRRHSSAGSRAQFVAMLTDFVPEAVALGALLVSRSSEAALLAFLIGAQNLPEAFNAWRELQASNGRSNRRLMALFLALAAVGPLSVGVGFLVLSDRPEITGAIMMAAAGGILFLMFQDIAVKAHLENRQGPSLAAVAGFTVGILGKALTG
jgi:ZIP family zinc transporter